MEKAPIVYVTCEYPDNKTLAWFLRGDEQTNIKPTPIPFSAIGQYIISDTHW